MQMMKIKGNIGSPGLIPLVGLKKGVLLPFTKIQIEEVVRQDIIRLVSL